MFSATRYRYISINNMFDCKIKNYSLSILSQLRSQGAFVAVLVVNALVLILVLTLALIPVRVCCRDQKVN